MVVAYKSFRNSLIIHKEKTEERNIFLTVLTSDKINVQVFKLLVKYKRGFTKMVVTS